MRRIRGSKVSSEVVCLNNRPLVVDMDGTLIYTDLLHESALRLFREKPLKVFMLPLKLGQGRARLKQYLAQNTELIPETLPYNQQLLQWLREERDKGRRLILCTASNQKFARQVADFLGLFDEVIASDASTNLKGKNKAQVLCDHFGRGEFDYAGDSFADLPVWECAGQAIVVNATASLESAVRACCTIASVFKRPTLTIVDWARALRVQQWLKNLLLLAPMLAAHRVTDVESWWLLALAFLSFSLVASATYLVNDLFDLHSDRLHPRKQYRPLAAGLISVPTASLLAGGLLALGIFLAFAVNGAYLFCLLIYLFVTACYSWFFKRLVLLDCIALAVLYTLRIIAGAAAIDMGLSFWLLAFSAFLFMSLALIKRYAELEVQLLEGRDKAHGRGYLTSDASLLQTLGVSSGFAAVLVLSLYLNSDEVLVLYATPEIVWGAVLVLLYWISWMWMQAHRGLMHDDPLIFAIKERSSLLAGALFLCILLLGTVQTPW